MKARNLIAILLLLMPLRLLAAVETYSERIEGAAITTSATYTVYDDKYLTMFTGPTAWQSVFTNYAVKNRVRLGINPEVLQTNALSGGVTIEIRYWTWNAGTNSFDLQPTVTKTLAVDYSMTGTNAIDEMCTHTFNGAHRVEVKVTSVNGGGSFDVNDVYLQSEIEVERYYAFGGAAPASPSVSVSNDYCEFEWSPVAGAEWYELEFVHINNYMASDAASIFTPSALFVNFYLNSTRVILRTPYYRIPALFDQGYLVFRVRAVGVTGTAFDSRKEGSWNLAESVQLSTLTAITNYVYFSGPNDDKMNWGHSVVYAEDGKRFEQVSFADALGRGRQALGRNTETGQTVVSNIYYDGYGRPAISDLPTPDDSEELTHRPGFNRAEGAEFYAPEHFDQNQIEEGDGCSYTTTPFSLESGAGKYYSPENPDQDAENARIPDANQYPFSRVEYMNDHTGRIRRIGAAGEEYQIGSGHETKFLYGTPSQEELTRLFGSEVGYHTHYQKRITVDANNQAYIEYFDMAGRVIASGMIGKAPENLMELDENDVFTLTQTIAEGINGNVTPTSMTLTYPITITEADEEGIAFDYSLNPAEFTDETCAPELCLDCMYELKIEIAEEECGDVVHSETLQINGFEYNAMCNADTPYEHSFNVPLEEKTYIVTKTLTVDEDAINGYWCTYLENNTCIPTYADIFNELYENADFGACDNVDEYDTDNESCNAMRQIMLHDMMPGGQYAEYTVSGATYSAANTISVLYTGGSPELSGNWKNPSGDYLDDLGNIALVEVAYIGGGVYNPPITGTAVGPLPNGNYTVHPEQLVNLSDFVLKFEDSWAEALLEFHPEYCYYEYCKNNENSQAHDQNMLGVTTMQAAVDAGYFAPTGSIFITPGAALPCQTAAPPCNNTSAPDPFFVENPSYEPAIEAVLDVYITIDGIDFSMIDYAIYQNTCPELTYGPSINTCVRDYKSGCYDDMIWLTFRDLYLEAKAVIYAQAEADFISGEACASVVELIGTDSPGNPFADATPRWGFIDEALNTDYSLQVPDPETQVNQTMDELCETACELYAEEWIAQLSHCPEVAAIINDPDSTTLNKLKEDLAALCAYGCGTDHPSGASTLPAGISPFALPNGGSYGSAPFLYAGAGINDLLALYIDGFTESDLCTELLISDPGPYQEDLDDGAYLDECGCDLLLATKAEFGLGNLPAGVTTIEELLEHNTGLSMEDIDLLICQCQEVASDWTPNYAWSGRQTETIASWKEPVGAQLTCNSCVDCEKAQDVHGDLVTRFGSGITESENYPLILTNFFNLELGFDLTYSHYSNFLLQCTGTPSEPVCVPTDELLAFGDMLDLLVHRGQLTSESPVDLLADNIVYRKGALFDYLDAIGYSITVLSETTIQVSFYEDESTTLSCTTDLILPEDPGFSFSDIVAVNSIYPIAGSCEGNPNQFALEVSYYDCGELKTAIVSGSSDCFPVQHCSCGSGLLCNETIHEQLEDQTPCYEPLLSQLYQEAEEAYAVALGNAYTEFAAAYNAKCASAFETELFEYTGPFNQYHYTLFYYDQAGNLVRTVAPKDVVPLTDTDPALASLNNTTGIDDQEVPEIPGHTSYTTYSFNSYNQPVSTANPDQSGVSTFWYDRYGRIVASQNPVQAAINTYSYILYDNIGRPVETGQVVKTGGLSEATVKANDLGYAFTAWVTSVTRTEVNYTFYDEYMSSTVAAKFAAGTQQNLRLRIASVAYYDEVNDGTIYQEDYTNAIHYSYDIHGNVIETLQDIPSLTPVQQDIKSTQYAFELISGNVQKVEYQKGKRDRMTHEYSYDRLNRLREVRTSTDDGVHKATDARYRYFDYGPLARTEIGQHNVQGNDYTYTINGWLKALNGTTLNVSRDGGKDGGYGYYAANTNAHELFARDVTGFTLGYYQGDYKSIGSTAFEAAIGSDDLSDAIHDLYNGNIAWTTTAIEGFADVHAGVYRYDQLQRLRSMDVFASSSALNSSNSWAGVTATTDYASTYTYDPNGNLTNLKRRDGGGNLIDDFDYKYALHANRLVYVDDGAGTTSGYAGDIEPGQSGTAGLNILLQSGNNYQYDLIGQLVKDVQEQQEYEWRSGDKKLKLQKSTNTTGTQSQLEFMYNPLGQRVLKIRKTIVGGVLQPESAYPYEYTFYAYDANGQVMATYKLTNTSTVKIAELDERMIYGAGRLGTVQSSTVIYTNQSILLPVGPTLTSKLGRKQYELTNHLGNVNAVITDRKIVDTDFAAGVNYETGVTTGWTTSSSCGGPTLLAMGGQLIVSSGSCTTSILRHESITAGSEYTFSVDLNRANTVDMDVELWASNSTTPGTGTMLTSWDNPASGQLTYSFTAPGGTTLLRMVFKKNSTETSLYGLDNIRLNTQASRYKAVVIMKADYYPFGMTMDDRYDNGVGYRYAYNGMEVDPEMKGDGNSYTTEFRQYDPRLGRWASLDPLMMQFPWMSPYVGFDDNPVVYVDLLGLEAESDFFDVKTGKKLGHIEDGTNRVFTISKEKWDAVNADMKELKRDPSVFSAEFHSRAMANGAVEIKGGEEQYIWLSGNGGSDKTQRSKESARIENASNQTSNVWKRESNYTKPTFVADPITGPTKPSAFPATDLSKASYLDNTSTLVGNTSFVFNSISTYRACRSLPNSPINMYTFGTKIPLRSQNYRLGKVYTAPTLGKINALNTGANVLSFYSMATSTYTLASNAFDGDPNTNNTARNYSDAVFGIAGGVGILYASNPIGWFCAAGSGLYGLVTFIYDLSQIKGGIYPDVSPNADFYIFNQIDNTRVIIKYPLR